MPICYTITPEVLSNFKEPFGTLIEGSFSETANKLACSISQQPPTKIITIGDTVTRNLNEHKISPDLAITDNRNLREPVKPQVLPKARIIQVKNPPGVITEEAIDVIRQALQTKEPIHLQVEGEEDMLTLPVVLYAPENSLVVYGQPHKGIVVVKVTAQKKTEAQKIWNQMEILRE